MARHGNPRYRPILLLAVVVAVGAGASSCDSCQDRQVMTPDPPSPTISVTPAGPVALPVGQTVQLVASLTNAGSSTTAFTSSNTSVATVDVNTGLVRCVAVGTAIVTARATGTNAGVAINVSQAVTINCSGTATTPSAPGG